MPEVFTISGSGFGQVAPCPAGWAVTPNGNCGAPLQNCPPSMKVGNACRSPAAIALQNALRALGNTARDPRLQALAVDGFVGPSTVAAVNLAFTKHVGAGQAAARYRTGALTQVQVANEAAALAGVIGSEVSRRGGAVPAVPAFVAKAAPAAVTPEVVEPIGPPRSLWALVGLNLLAVGAGVYLSYYPRG